KLNYFWICGRPVGGGCSSPCCDFLRAGKQAGEFREVVMSFCVSLPKQIFKDSDLAVSKLFYTHHFHGAWPHDHKISYSFIAVCFRLSFENSFCKIWRGIRFFLCRPNGSYIVGFVCL